MEKKTYRDRNINGRAKKGKTEPSRNANGHAKKGQTKLTKTIGNPAKTGNIRNAGGKPFKDAAPKNIAKGDGKPFTHGKINKLKGESTSRRAGNSKQSWKPGNMLYPVPAVMVSCKRADEKPNIITIAWAGTICSDPVMASISVRKSRYSHSIIKETGEFVINLVTCDMAFACDWCGVKSGKDVDKFSEMKLHEYYSEFVKAPAIKESPVNIYCKVKQVLELGSHDMFVAQVVGVTVSEQYMDENGRFDLDATELIAYSHGSYFELGKKLGSFGYSVRKK